MNEDRADQKLGLVWRTDVVYLLTPWFITFTLYTLQIEGNLWLWHKQTARPGQDRLASSRTEGCTSCVRAWDFIWNKHSCLGLWYIYLDLSWDTNTLLRPANHRDCAISAWNLDEHTVPCNLLLEIIRTICRATFALACTIFNTSLLHLLFVSFNNNINNIAS